MVNVSVAESGDRLSGRGYSWFSSVGIVLQAVPRRFHKITLSQLTWDLGVCSQEVRPVLFVLPGQFYNLALEPGLHIREGKGRQCSESVNMQLY